MTVSHIVDSTYDANHPNFGTVKLQYIALEQLENVNLFVLIHMKTRSRAYPFFQLDVALEFDQCEPGKRISLILVA